MTEKTNYQKITFIQGALIGLLLTTQKNNAVVREALDYANQLLSVLIKDEKVLQG